MAERPFNHSAFQVFHSETESDLLVPPPLNCGLNSPEKTATNKQTLLSDWTVVIPLLPITVAAVAVSCVCPW